MFRVDGNLINDIPKASETIVDTYPKFTTGSSIAYSSKKYKIYDG